MIGFFFKLKISKINHDVDGLVISLKVKTIYTGLALLDETENNSFINRQREN